MAVAEKLKQFEQSGGKVLWIDQVPGGAEHENNNPVVNAYLKTAEVTPVKHLAESIAQSCSPEVDLSFTPGTDQLTVGRFLKDGDQVYLLVNREQEGIQVQVKGNRKGKEQIKVLDPSTGNIGEIPLPAKLTLEANRAMMLIPDESYLKGDLLND